MSSPRPRSAIEWFETLCDLPPEEALEALDDVPADTRDVVRDMLAADRAGERDGELDPSFVYWNLVAELARDVPADPQPDEPPEIDGYDVLHPLGAGGMGQVYEAEQHQPRRRVAIKVLRASGAEALQAAVAEAQALADVQHPTIPRVLQVGVAGPLAFLAMDLIRGESITAWGQGRPLEARLEVMVPLCRGVQAAHDAGVLHRDLKPANVLIEEGGGPRIVDFGLAGSQQAEDPVAGTLAYLSDERLAGASASVASDVYALGVTLYELVTGRRPYPPAGVPSLRAEARCRKAPVTPPSARGIGDADLDAILARALAPEGGRYPTARALGDDLHAWLQRRPVSARPASALRRARMWIRRNPRLVVAVALTATLVSTTAAGLIAGARWSEQRRAQQAERRAEERLLALQEALAATYPDGAEDAERTLQIFASDLEVRGTRAERAAWMWHHEQLLATGQRQLARAALARAWLASRDHPERHQVRMAIARLLHDEGRWYSLLYALGDADGPEARRLRSRADIATRHLDGAQVEPELQPLLHALSQARRTPYRPISVTPLERTDPPMLAIAEESADRLTLVHRDVALRVERAHTLPEVVYGFENPAVMDDDPPWLLGSPRDRRDRLNVWRVRDGFALEGSVPSAAPLGGWTSADTDGDGALELYYGTLHPDRAVWTLRVGASGWQRLPMVPAGEDHASDVEVLRALDIDGDGDDEVLASSGLWRALDLRVADRRDGRLQWTDRVRLGGVPALAVSDAGGPWVVTATGNAGIGPSGARPPVGIRTYRPGADGRLVLEHAVPFPLPRPHGTTDVVLGDLDGDGREEILVTVETDTLQTWLVRFGPHGEATSLLLQGVHPLVAVQLDDDPADELLVRIVDDDHHMWVLGAGDDALPAWRPGEPTSPASGDPIDELLRMGFGVETADALSAADDHARAADLLARQERWRDAVAQYDEALAVASEADRERLVERRTRAARAGHLLEAPTWTASLAQPLPPALQAHRPGRLAWRSGADGLRVDGTAADGVLAELPLVATGGGDALGMETSWRIDELEPGARLAIQLIGADDRIVLSTGASAWGGNRQVSRTGTCRGPSDTDRLLDIGDMRPVTDHRTTHTQRAHVSGGEVLCELRRSGAFRNQAVYRAPDVPPGPYRLRLVATPETPRVAASRFVATLQEVRLWGLRPASPPEDAEHRARLAWVTGDLDAALRWHGPEPPISLLLAVGRGREAARLVARLDPSDPDARRELLAGLRRQPSTWLSMVRRSLPEHFPALYRDAWLPGVAGHRSDSVRATLDHPFVDELPPTEDLLPFLFYRAMLIADEGEVHRARRLLERLLPIARDGWAVDVHLALARALVEHEPARARQHCERARAIDRWFIADDAIADDAALSRVCVSRR